MDALPSTVSTFSVPTHHSIPREFYLFRTPNTSNQIPPHLTPKPKSISNKNISRTLSIKNVDSPRLSTSQTLSLKPSPNTHRNPASGYAAALLDISQCNRSLETVQNDVKRLSKRLQDGEIRAVLTNPFMGGEEKGQIVKEVAKSGKFHRLLVGLVKMLVERNKVAIVRDVLMEFERIYDELCGARVVMVSSSKKMEEDELFEIAQRVL